ncbi:NAD-dependent epimerase/dehydratase family protein [Sphaerospermopsis sp. LEGE 00249]|uniref:NAD-dependent epimerase/dehydratase family protein n=1 Tax=Sphaerospermopsis sp. LEGE 00249 TaxID=1380707 RepID=UPI00164DDB55|nr:NAD-dependent epimerase/dehydratase family protein [Sphaerospermopsis sp. LEGE 00249]MBC5793619.1 NAD-dependent epimerase/dehydratase family protein [Sphaerospermopsis sp. LEGE 00249]
MQEFTNQKILVVGGAGFVGSNLVKTLLLSEPQEIIVVDNLLSAEKENLPKDSRVIFIEGSITDNNILAQLNSDLDYVFHLATYHGNQSSIHDPLADHENNTLTTLKLYEAIKDLINIKKVVYSSAGCTVAEKTFEQAEATTEDAPVSLYLDSPYQISKIIGEFYSNYYFKRHNLPVVKARFQNVYGPGEVLGAGQWRGTPATVWRNVIPTFIYRALRQMPLTVENGGIATRDFIYVDDIVQGLILCATKGIAGETYNLASGVETSILELANLINELTSNPTPLDFRPKREWDNSGKRFGSSEKSRTQLGFESEIDLPKGLINTINWTKNNFSFIEKCIQKHHNYMN